MYQNHTVGVVIPCHNEQLLITRVIDTMPDYVDRIYVVDDHSSDNTVQVVKEYITSKGVHHQNRQRTGRVDRTYHQSGTRWWCYQWLPGRYSRPDGGDRRGRW